MNRVLIFLISIPLFLSLSMAAQASLQTRERQTGYSALQPRILNVYSRDNTLFIVGQNLPHGEGVAVQLGDRELEVIWTDSQLAIVKMLPIRPALDTQLVVRRGVREARIRGAKVLLGLLLDP